MLQNLFNLSPNAEHSECSHFSLQIKTLHNKKLLELINKFSKVAGYKVNKQKSVCFYIHEQPEKEIKKILFTIASKRIK